MYNFIINPNNFQKISIFSKIGNNILKKYIKSIDNSLFGGGKWIKHVHGKHGNFFYRKKGDNKSITLHKPNEKFTIRIENSSRYKKWFNKLFKIAISKNKGKKIKWIKHIDSETKKFFYRIPGFNSSITFKKPTDNFIVKYEKTKANKHWFRTKFKIAKNTLSKHTLSSLYKNGGFKIASFNIARDTAANKFKKNSSARFTVARCIKSKQDCWLNAARFLKANNIDLIGIQENKERLIPFCNILGNYGAYTSNNGFWPGSTTVIYNKKFGNVLHINNKKLNPKKNIRGISTIYIHSLGILFSSIWLSHSHTACTQGLEDVCKSLEYIINNYKLPVKRIIFTMDSNDHYSSILNRKFYINIHHHKFILQQPKWTGDNKSCCEDNKFIVPGDYIFDSQSHKSIYYQIPTLPNGTNKMTQLMSDHLPIFNFTSI